MTALNKEIQMSLISTAFALSDSPDLSTHPKCRRMRARETPNPPTGRELSLQAGLEINIVMNSIQTVISMNNNDLIRLR